MGDPQWLPGYGILLTDNTEIERLSDLPRPKRAVFLQSMADLSEAVERACAQADNRQRIDPQNAHSIDEARRLLADRTTIRP